MPWPISGCLEISVTWPLLSMRMKALGLKLASSVLAGRPTASAPPATRGSSTPSSRPPLARVAPCRKRRREASTMSARALIRSPPSSSGR